MTSKFIVAPFGLLFSSLGAGANSFAHWPDQHPPPMSLSQALDLAQKEMGPKYYCTYSSLCSSYESQEPGKNKPLVYHAVWTFNFSSLTGKTKEVLVFGSGKHIQVEVEDLVRDVL